MEIPRDYKPNPTPTVAELAREMKDIEEIVNVLEVVEKIQYAFSPAAICFLGLTLIGSYYNEDGKRLSRAKILKALNEVLDDREKFNKANPL